MFTLFRILRGLYIPFKTVFFIWNPNSGTLMVLYFSPQLSNYIPVLNSITQQASRVDQKKLNITYFYLIFGIINF